MPSGEPTDDASPESAGTGAGPAAADHVEVAPDLSQGVGDPDSTRGAVEATVPERDDVGDRLGVAEPAGSSESTAAADPTVQPGQVTADRADRGRHRAPAKSRTSGKAPKRRAPWWELPALILAAVLIAIGVKSFVIQPFYIPSQSMEHTLYGCPGCSGDRILVFKPIYWFRDPEPGDIVVFNAPPGWDNEPSSTPPSNVALRAVRGFGQLIGVVPPDGEILVKRVIAVGGQTVKGDTSGDVYVSDHGPGGPYRKLYEPFVFNDPGRTNPAFGPVTVPRGRLWVMGDHRTDSADSRYHCAPSDQGDAYNDLDCDPTSSTVPIDNVIGKAVVIAWPPSRWTTLGTPSTFDSAASVGASGVAPLGAVVPLFLLRRRRRRR